MTKIKVAINGFGRIGRNVYKIALDRSDIEIVGINDLTDTKTLAHLLKYDSTQGKFQGDVSFDEKALIVNGKKTPVHAERSPAAVPWVVTPDVVIESTGIFTSRESAKGGYGDHLKNGAKKVILCVPAKDEIDNMIVLGVNDHALRPEDKCVSNASCTTNCLAPVAKVLNDSFGIEQGFMTTIHSYTNDQSNVDIARAGDASKMIRGRAAAQNMIPTSTGAAKAIGEIYPDLKGKLDGIAIRVPTVDGSVVDLKCVVEKSCTANDINAKMKEYAENSLKGILYYSEDPIVSSDIIGDPHSSIFSSIWTKVINDEIFVLSYYDNEWGFSNRMAELIIKRL